MSRDDEDRGGAAEPKDHREPLSQRDTFEMYRYDKAVRPYLFGALGALAMIFLVTFVGGDSSGYPGSDIGAVALGMLGVATVAFRWTAAPPFFVLLLLYFRVFPFGLPDPSDLYDNRFLVGNTHFQIADVILVLAVLVYLRCQYRLFGVVNQAMPFENMYRSRIGGVTGGAVEYLVNRIRAGDSIPLRRPTSHIRPTEIAWLVGIAAGLVVLGQAAWWVVNGIEFVPNSGDVPFRWVGSKRSVVSRLAPGEFTRGGSRFFVILGVMGAGLLLVRLVFGYWRLRNMTAAEGAMVLTDTNWSESHRELVRVEKWRLWSKHRAIEERKAARAEREKRRKEEEARARAEARAREREREAERERDRARRRRDEDDGDDRPRRRRPRDDD